MKTLHKHAELIKKWADDTSLIIQYKQDGKWTNVKGTPFWSDITEYRIKPEVIRYRVALFDNKSTTTCDTVEQESGFNKLDGFKKWLTDWIEVEI